MHWSWITKLCDLKSLTSYVFQNKHCRSKSYDPITGSSGGFTDSLWHWEATSSNINLSFKTSLLCFFGEFSYILFNMWSSGSEERLRFTSKSVLVRKLLFCKEWVNRSKFFSNDRQKVSGFKGKRRHGGTGKSRGRETIIEIYYLRKESIFKKTWENDHSIVITQTRSLENILRISTLHIVLLWDTDTSLHQNKNENMQSRKCTKGKKFTVPVDFVPVRGLRLLLCVYSLTSSTRSVWKGISKLFNYVLFGIILPLLLSHCN